MTRNIDQIITDQVLTWKQKQKTVAQEDKTQSMWPIMTISREFGAQGSELADAIGKRTGFAVWDKALVHAIAEKVGRNETVLRSVDEQRRKVIEDAVHTALVSSSLSNTHYLRALMRLIHTIAAHGKSIIVGRGAHFILDPASIFRIRVVCPLEQRVRFYAEQTNLSLRTARKKVIEIDALREDFIKYHFKKNADLPEDYDLLINTGVYDLQQSIDIIATAYKAKTGLNPLS